MAFSSVPEDVRALLGRATGLYHIAGRLQVNEWNGTRSAQLVIEDAADA